MKDKNLYICKVPLKMKHLYTAPSEQTIDESWGSWVILSKNMAKGTVRMARSKDQNTRMQITFEMLEKHFKIINCVN